VKDITEYSAGKNGPFWVDGNLIRFRNGYPTKIGGWEKEIVKMIDPSGSITITERFVGFKSKYPSGLKFNPPSKEYLNFFSKNLVAVSPTELSVKLFICLTPVIGVSIVTIITSPISLHVFPTTAIINFQKLNRTT